MDDQERHYIGSLLCDEDVLTQNSPRNIETSTSPLCQSAKVLPSSGPIGPTPNRTFWPEPPPPYSPYTMAPPQWSGISHQRTAMLTGQYSQPPNSTTVTHSDFYRIPHCQAKEWNPDSILAPVDSYMLCTSQKSMMGTGPTDTMQQYHGMYGHRQQLENPHANEPLINSSRTTATMYSGMNRDGRIPPFDLHMRQHLPPIINKSYSHPLQFKEIGPSLFPMENTALKATTMGKLYSEATKNERAKSVSEVAPLVANSTNTRLISTKSADNKETVLRRVSTSRTGFSDRYSGGNVIQVGAARDEARICDAKKMNLSGKIGAKKGGDCRKKTVENVFQKITHKKNRSTKGGRNEQPNGGEDGAKVVDASSRFNILQSLGAQAAAVVTRRNATSHRLSSSAELKREEADKMTGAKRIEENVDNRSKVVESELIESSEADRTKARKGSITAQNGILKKLMGIPRELCASATNEEPRKNRKQRSLLRKRQSTMTDHLNLILALVLGFVSRCLRWIVDLVVDISLQLWDIASYVVSAAFISLTINCTCIGHSVLEWLRTFYTSIVMFSREETTWSEQQNALGGFGLSENIQLPATGEEAMERLLKCHGRDAYVVLGLKANCSDDDIKRHYKRQAVLVHPDKNRLSGAEEAFKILSKAFDAIGTPLARTKYNRSSKMLDNDDPLARELEELWERFRKKMDESRNAMYCDCGGKHVRIPVENLRTSEARYCNRCQTRHPAKHNDIWAETRFFGLCWVYYACLDGMIYDISQWANCASNRLKHLKANNHSVQYRLVTTSGTTANGKGSSRGRKQQRKEELEDMCCYNCGTKFEDEEDCSCCLAHGYGNASGSVTSQQASYRPPERSPFHGDRPRRAGRRRKLR